MSQIVVINLGSGTLSTGCNHVVAEILPGPHSRPTQKCVGSLPPDLVLAELFRNYRLLYGAFYGLQSGLNRELKVHAEGLTHFSRKEFMEVTRKLEQQLNVWLLTDGFQSIYQEICQHLQPQQEIRLILETDDPLLRRLPWQLWNFFDAYPRAELALSNLAYGQMYPQSQTANGKVRILAIFGNGEGLNLEADRSEIKALPGAEVVFLDTPTRKQLNEALWDKQGWDILFFAGHSQTDTVSGVGELLINEKERLSLSQLRHALREAISRGLTLAIFNSCDGLGLAQRLAELNIPQVIVMRELVPDPVAQEFFKNFLRAFAGQQSVFNAVREARERLEGLENEYPCATWLPVLCQNPTTDLKSWYQLQFRDHREKYKLTELILTSIAVATSIFGIRQIGVLQSIELAAYDHLMRQKPSEKTDDRFLIIKVTSEDPIISKDPKLIRSGAKSLPDSTLLPLLDKLKSYKPRSIGLDVFRGTKEDWMPRKLEQHFEEDNFFGICQFKDIKDEEHTDIPPPPSVNIERQGFSDVPNDPNGVVRRSLLVGTTSTYKSKCKTEYSLSARLAMHYLEQDGIATRFPDDLIMGETAIKKFPRLNDGHDILKHLNSINGSYKRIEDIYKGYQILINYRKGSPTFDAIQIQEFLEERVDKKRVEDKVVLIGVVDKSYKDYHSTPLNSNDDMPGVILQAQMTSQLLSAALDKRAMMSSWPLWVETIWILGLAWVGSLAMWACRSRLFLSLGVGITLEVIVYCICFLLFIKGLWVPIVPGCLALGITGISLAFLSVNKNLNKE